VKGEAPKKNLALRFCEFAFKVLNQDMDDFFEDNMDAFDQDVDELQSGRGETFEQYEAYKQYVQELEIHFDEFATIEGYESSMDCFRDINDLVIDDAEERKIAMKEMAERMKASFEAWQKKFSKDAIEADSKADGKTADDESDKKHASDSKHSAGVSDFKSDSKGSESVIGTDEVNHEESPPPVMMFFQPVSLEAMLNHVLTLTEYTTFSHIMRTKVRQRQLLQILQSNVERQPRERSRRQRQLDARVDLVDVFEELVDRLCGLTPHQKMLHTEIRKQLDVNAWKELLTAGSDNAIVEDKYKMIFRRLTMSVCMCLWNLVSMAQQMTVRQALTDFLPQIDAIETSEDVERTAAIFLDMTHGLVDETELKMVEVLEDHYAHHRERRRAARTDAK